MQCAALPPALHAPRPPIARPIGAAAKQATLKQKEAELDVVAPYSRSFGRTLVNTILESEGGGVALVRMQLGPWSLHTKRGVDVCAATFLAGGAIAAVKEDARAAWTSGLHRRVLGGLHALLVTVSHPGPGSTHASGLGIHRTCLSLLCSRPTRWARPSVWAAG